VDDEKRHRLIDLGAESLADALLELANWDERAEDLLERMISTREESITRFKKKLAALHKIRKFIPWGRSAAFARELASILEDLRAGTVAPRIGVQLTADFFHSDSSVFEHCDDSSGHVGWVYSYDACKLFSSFASDCDDKHWIVDLVLNLIREDDYSVRASLVESAGEYLPDEMMLLMVDRLWQLTDDASEDYEKRHWCYKIESLARQLHDAPLFEKARRIADPDISAKSAADIAKVYLDAGDAATALSWMERVPDPGNLSIREGSRLLLDIHRKLGNTEETTKVLWRIFREHRSEDSLSELLEVIGKDQRKAIIDAEVKTILEEKRLSYSDINFLIEIGCLNDVEVYLLNRSKQINGKMYYTLLPIAETLRENRYYLAATVVYRSLLDSILERGKSKAYHHGKDYLEILFEMAQSITDWASVTSHQSYANTLLEIHSRKRSFWSCYRE
jgi:hypothetical protein